MSTTDSTAIPNPHSQTRSAAVELKKLSVLTTAGCLAFMASTFVFSRLPVAHEFRQALSIDYLSGVFIGPFFGGLAISGLISFLLLRFFKKIPTNTPILKSTLLSVGALSIATLVMLMSVSGIADGAFHYFIVGTMLNVPRFLALGLVVGYLYGRLPDQTRSRNEAGSAIRPARDHRAPHDQAAEAAARLTPRPTRRES